MACKGCGKKLLLPLWKKAVYCNRACYEKHRDKRLVKCVVCGKEIKIIGNRYKKSQTKRFTCSVKCMGEKNRGTNNSNYGNHVLAGKNNPSYKARHRINCLMCGRFVWAIEFYRGKRKFCSRKCQHEYSVGKNSSGWHGGKSKEEYPYTFNNRLKRFVRNRDGYKCQICGVPQQECINALCVHHIDYNKQNNEVSNLISLCYKCHNQTISKREYWTKRFLNFMEVYHGNVSSRP